MNKWDKIKLLIASVDAFVEAVSSDDATEEEYDISLKKLKAAHELISNHTMREKRLVEDHPEADYYTIQLEGKEIRVARCKYCGKEINPKHFARHYKSNICEMGRAKRLGLTPPKPKKARKKKVKSTENSVEVTTESQPTVVV